MDGSGLGIGIYNIDPERNRLHGNKQQPHAPRPLRRRHSSGSSDSPEGYIKNKLSSESNEKYPKVMKTSPGDGDKIQELDVSPGIKDTKQDMDNDVLEKQAVQSPIAPGDIVSVKDTESDESDLNVTETATVAPSQGEDDIPFADDDSDEIIPVTRNMPVVLRRRKGMFCVVHIFGGHFRDFLTIFY